MGSERFYNVAVNELSVYLQMPKIVRQDIIFIHTLSTPKDDKIAQAINPFQE